jgi:hypothetical protein
MFISLNEDVIVNSDHIESVRWNNHHTGICTLSARTISGEYIRVSPHCYAGVLHHACCMTVADMLASMVLHGWGLEEAVEAIRTAKGEWIVTESMVISARGALEEAQGKIS